MLAAALVVADGLGRGFDRATRAADLPDIIARFDPTTSAGVARRIRALPDLAAFTLRAEATDVPVYAAGHFSTHTAVELVGPGRRGYAIVAGHDLNLRDSGQTLVEKGLADAWGLQVGDTVRFGRFAARIVGLTESPDNVAYPLAAARLYLPAADAASTVVNQAAIWLRDAAQIDTVLVQARATSYGIHGLRFVTRSGVRVLLDQAAGIVIDLLVALSAIALLTATVLLAASARAETQRRLRSLGIRRAIGASRGHLTLIALLEAALVALPAAALGTLAGGLATLGATGRLLTLLNEPAPGASAALPLAGACAVAVLVPALASAWPAFRATGRPPLALLRGAELTAAPGRRAQHRRSDPATRADRPASRATPRSGLASLGARLATARRARLLAAVAALGSSCAFVLLMLALASALTSLETDPGALGKRYQLEATLPASAVGRVARIPGVAAVAPRYEIEALDSFSLHETIDVIAYPGDHTAFEAPPLTAGRRLHGSGEAEVGAGLAGALGLSPGSPLAVELPNGRELRLTVSGVVGSLAHDGRVAYVPAAALLALDPAASAKLAIRLTPTANAGTVQAELGEQAAPASGATARGAPLVAVLRTILRAIAIVDALVCLYALVQTCALTVLERRRSVSVLRAFGAEAAAIRRLLAGSLAALVIPAALLGVAVERWLLGPALAHLAAGYATLDLAARPAEILAVLAGLLVCSAIAVAWVAARTARQTVLSGLAAT